MTGQPEEPVLRVLTPSATPEEIAAIVAVLAASGAPAKPEALPRSRWASPRRMLTPTYPHGRGAWRGSGLPR
ncbi:MAG: acyl-CoA carboxylase epsilon subunit [Marmoricola sp.]